MLCFFDEATGTWLPMPLAWERHVPAISNMTSKIQVLQQGERLVVRARCIGDQPVPRRVISVCGIVILG